MGKSENFGFSTGHEVKFQPSATFNSGNCSPGCGEFQGTKKKSISFFVLWFRGPKLGVVENFGNCGYIFKGYQLDRITETHHTIYHSKEQIFAVRMAPSISGFDFLFNEDGRRKKKKPVLKIDILGVIFGRP